MALYGITVTEAIAQLQEMKSVVSGQFGAALREEIARKHFTKKKIRKDK